MYDLPSEDPEGLPDEYHYLQPQLLSTTFQLKDYGSEQVFTAGDLNLYYDIRHPFGTSAPTGLLSLMCLGSMSSETCA